MPYTSVLLFLNFFLWTGELLKLIIAMNTSTDGCGIIIYIIAWASRKKKPFIAWVSNLLMVEFQKNNSRCTCGEIKQQTLLESVVHEWTSKWSTRGDHKKMDICETSFDGPRTWTTPTSMRGHRQGPRADHAQSRHMVCAWTSRENTKILKKKKYIRYFSIMYVLVLLHW